MVVVGILAVVSVEFWQWVLQSILFAYISVFSLPGKGAGHVQLKEIYRRNHVTQLLPSYTILSWNNREPFWLSELITLFTKYAKGIEKLDGLVVWFERFLAERNRP